MLTKTRVQRLREGETIWDHGGVRGFGARRQSGADVSFFLKFRYHGRQRRLTIGKLGAITIAQARKAAEIARGKVARGIDPATEKIAERAKAKAEVTTAFETVAAEFIKRYAKPNTRSWQETERIIDRYVKPAWKGRALGDIRRSDVTALLDRVEDKSGPVMADHVLAVVRKQFNWYAARDEDFRSPVVKGMARTKPKERSRKRILSDTEIRALWTASEKIAPAAYGSLIRFLLLTAQRRDEAGQMQWAEIDGEVWTIPGERYKTALPNTVPLSTQAKSVLDGVARFGAFVFTTTGKAPFSGFSKAKAGLDERMLDVLRETDPKAKLEAWVLHDLRRTARSLMSRAGVPVDHAERVLGHVIPGVRGIYDRHSFLEEKRDALAKLATLVDRITNPPEQNVVPLRVG